MRYVQVFSFLYLLIYSQLGMGQSNREYLHQAQSAFERADYFKASEYYKQAAVINTKNKSDLLNAGISSYRANDLEFALKCFQLLETFSDEKKLQFYLAQTQQQLNQFEQAQIHYKNYLKSLSANHPDVSFCRNELIRCQAGIHYIRKKAQAFVVSLSSAINSPEDEMNVIPDLNQTGVYHLSAVRKENEGGKRNKEGLVDLKQGHYNTDLFRIQERNESWTMIPKANSAWNSSMNDELAGYFNGHAVILQYPNEQYCKFIIDTFNDDSVHLRYPEFKGPLIPEIGDHSFCIFQDSLMIFSSCRAGGYGAYDLYLSVLRNSNWTEPMNLGPQINGPFNEDFPFILNDGRSLYFSSDNLQSMGGFDIFKTRFQPEAAEWEKPINPGVPINSAGDDIYFKMDRDGLSGTMSSNRKLDNQGGFDIYKIFFKDEMEEHMQAAQGSPLSILIDNESATAHSNLQNEGGSKILTKHPDFQEYFIESIYYKDQEIQADTRSQKTLQQLVELLKIYPSIKLTLLGHAFEESPLPINLYFSMQKAREVQTFLQTNGIDIRRIKLVALGSAYPIALTQVNGINSVVSEKFNKRIDFSFEVPENLNLRIHKVNPSVPSSLKPEKLLDFQIKRKGISYSIYLGESNSVLKHPAMKMNGNLFFAETHAEESMIKYYQGVYPKFEDAFIANKQLVKTSNEPAPMIYVFKDGNRLSRRELIDYIVQDADLINYLNYLNDLNR